MQVQRLGSDAFEELASAAENADPFPGYATRVAILRKGAMPLGLAFKDGGPDSPICLKRVTPETPAERAGLMVGDALLAVQGAPLLGLTVTDAVKLIRALPDGELAIVAASATRGGAATAAPVTPLVSTEGPVLANSTDATVVPKAEGRRSGFLEGDGGCRHDVRHGLGCQQRGHSEPSAQV